MTQPIPTISPHAHDWQAPTLLKVSLLIHIAAFAFVLFTPAQWQWALAVFIGNHVVIALAGLLPRASLLGKNMTRLPAAATLERGVCITIDDGPDPEITPQVLAILAKHNAKASFFCIGEKVESNPALARAMIAAGHRIENHSQSHYARLFALLTPAKMNSEVARAQTCITAITGQRPTYFRAPAGIRNPFLDVILHRHNLKLASWTRRAFDTIEKNPDVVLKKLCQNLKAGDILLLHDGNSARDQHKQATILNVLPRLLDEISKANLATVVLP